MDPPISSPGVQTAVSTEPSCNVPVGEAQPTTMWLKRRFPSDGFGTASVFETFGEHCIALGMPLQMLMVEERSEHRSGGSTIWIRLPASERAAYREFGEAPETALPKRAVLLIGHNGEFEKLFEEAEDDQLVQSRGDRHLPRQVDRRPAAQRRRHLRGR
jgi:hypothetical protein